MNKLEKLQNLVDEMNVNNSTSDKIATLKKYDDDDIKQLLRYVYSNFKNYYVSVKHLKKKADLHSYSKHYSDIIELLDDLDNRVITGNDGIAAVNQFINDNKITDQNIFSPGNYCNARFLTQLLDLTNNISKLLGKKEEMQIEKREKKPL